MSAEPGLTHPSSVGDSCSGVTLQFQQPKGAGAGHTLSPSGDPLSAVLCLFSFKSKTNGRNKEIQFKQGPNADVSVLLHPGELRTENRP